MAVVNKYDGGIGALFNERRQARSEGDNTGQTAVSVIIPAYNEEIGVGPQVEAVRQALSSAGIQHEIIVVDDGSHDRTGEQVLRAGARLFRHVENRGYGASLKTGIDAARHDTIAIIDADGTYPPDAIPGLLVDLEFADMVVGARTGKTVQVPLARRPAKWVLTWMAARIAGKKIPDLNSGLRVFRRECVKQYYPILSNRFSFTTTVTLALLADDYRVVYRPINYYARVGQSKITPRHFMDFMMLVFRMAILFQPMKIFTPVAFACGALGLLKLLYDVLSFVPRTGSFSWSILFQPVVSASAVLLLLMALQLLLIGMVADGALRRIAQHNGPMVPSHNVLAVEPYASVAPAPSGVTVPDATLTEA